MNIIKSLRKLKETWITPEEQPSTGGLTLKTPDGKTEVTVIITKPKDAYKAKQLVSLALGDVESDELPYHLGMVDMGGDDIE